LATGDFLEFLKEIHASRPELFCDKTADVQGLFSKMTFVHSAWKRLNIMRKSKERWSEADYAANVLACVFLFGSATVLTTNI
jgi:hypothetical protein